MDRKNFYHNQLVMEDELDAPFEYAETAEKALAQDAGICPDAVTGSYGPDVFGGIIEGCVVTYDAGNPHLANISEGKVRRADGTRIAIPASTVALSHTGSTPEGDSSAAVGDGAAITGSCSSGNRIVATLFAVPDEALSDAATDGTGATVYFTVEESFHFELQIGAAFADPPGSTPTRASLSDSKVCLTDLILTNNAGTMELIGATGICGTDADWDALLGNYANNTGRRADILAMDESSDFPRNADLGISLRGDLRTVLHTLVKHLQRETSGALAPAGAETVGARAQAGSGLDYNTSGGVITAAQLSAGSIDEQLLVLLDAVNSKIDRGDDTIVPTAGRHYHVSGLTSGNQQAYVRYHNINAHVAREIEGYRGMLFRAPMVYDDFIYFDWTKQAKWGVATINGAVSHSASGADQQRGTVDVQSGGVGAGDSCLLYSPHCFRLGGDPWTAIMARFMVLSGSSDQDVRVGIHHGSGNAAAYIRIDLVSGTMRLHVDDSGGAAGPNSNDVSMGVAPAADTWYTICIWVVDTDTAVAIVNGGSPVTASIGGGSTFGDVAAYGFLESVSRTPGSGSETVARLDTLGIYCDQARDAS